ncbi:MAG TPA: outer membrane beta-barrel protein [Methylocella sp.]|nr:outer membrane beta-barrel protein [Methylocella sp.]
MLRRILLTSAGAMALTGAALAADLHPPPPPPVYVPPNWTGFYVGGTVGGTWTGNDSLSTTTLNVFDSGTIPGLAATSAALATSSGFIHPTAAFLGGGTLGYNYQFASTFVAGVELDISGISSDVRGAVVSTEASIPGTTLAQAVSHAQNLDFLGTIRGRLGYLVTPTLLVYGTGGLAYGQGQATTNLTQFATGPVAAAAGATNPYYATGFASCSGGTNTFAPSCTYSNTRVGWTAGGGLEWMFLPNWSFKVEYLYYNLGTANYTVGSLSNFSAAGPLLYTGRVASSATFSGNVVRVGLNYKFFTWPYAPAPVVAKY